MLPVLNLCIAETGVKVSPIRIINKKNRITHSKLSVGQAWNFLPNVITYSSNTFEYDDSEVLNEDITEFLKRLVPFAMPSSSPEVYVYVAQNKEPAYYNTMVLTTNRTVNGKVLFSISLLRTYTTAGGNEINNNIDPLVLDFVGHRESLTIGKNELKDEINSLSIEKDELQDKINPLLIEKDEIKTEIDILSKKLEDMEKLQTRPPVVIRGEIKLSKSEQEFLKEPNPVVVVRKKPLKKSKQPETPKKQAVQIVQELDSDDDDDGRPAAVQVLETVEELD